MGAPDEQAIWSRHVAFAQYFIKFRLTRLLHGSRIISRRALPSPPHMAAVGLEPDSAGAVAPPRGIQDLQAASAASTVMCFHDDWT
jgi:hypothetical protein